MKKCILLIASAIALYGITACSRDKKQEPKAAADKKLAAQESIQESLVSYEVASADIKRYDSLYRANFHNNPPIMYYTVRSIDLMAAMDIKDTACNYQYVRVNLALDTAFRFKLYVQPVVNAYISKDKPSKNTGGTGYYFNEKGEIISPEANDPRYLADLNAPCPNTCGN
jgi:hypothetical protein